MQLQKKEVAADDFRKNRIPIVLHLKETVTDAITRFQEDVRSGNFPGREQTYR